MSRNGHDCAGTVAHHDIVGNKDGNLLSVNGVDCRKAVKANAGFVLDKLSPFKFGLFGAFSPVSFNCVKIFDAVFILIEERMLRSHNHERYAEKSVRTGGVNPEAFVNILKLEDNERTGRFSNPVFLLKANIGKKVNMVKTLKQLIGIFRYAKIPDVLGLLNNFAVADVTLAAL